MIDESIWLMLDLTVTDMLIAMLGICSKEELDEEDEEALAAEEENAQILGEDGQVEPELTEEEIAERRAAIKNKILAVGKMSKLFSVLR
jgi:serine/threonine-protein phosphatase 2B catalytic subunit